MKFLKIALFIIFITITILYLQEHGNIQKRSLESKLDNLTRENDRLEQEIKSLEQKINKLTTDPKAVEKVAKRKLGMVGPDETIYIFDTHKDKK